MPMIDRHDPRLSIRVPVYISIDGDGDLYSKVVRLESQDISGGGFCFETSKKLPLEASSRVVVSKLGDLPDEAHIEGRVAWIKSADKGKRYRVGVQFDNFHQVSKDELVGRLESWGDFSREV